MGVPLQPIRRAPRPRARGLVVMIAALGLAGAACSAGTAPGAGDGAGAGSTGKPATTPSVTIADVPTSTDPPGQTSFRLYWMRDCAPPETATDITTCRIAPGSSRLTPEPDAPRAALAALMEGPSDLEALTGLSTNIRSIVKLSSFTVDADGLATVDFNRYFETAKTRPQVAQVVFTLTQFASVKQVQFRIDGMTNGATGVPPMDRDDFPELTPTLLVEQPALGATIGPTFKLAGVGASPDGKVPFRVEDEAGTVMLAGESAQILTAPGRRGTFGRNVELPPGSTGRRLVLVVEVRDPAGSGAPSPPIRIPITVA